MKRLIIPLAGLFLAAQVFSQDILTMKSGSRYEVKLIEITDAQLRFKMFDNLEGPIYNISRDSFVSIRYENGVEEVFARQPEEHSETIAINGYNTSASTSTMVPEPEIVTPKEEPYIPPQTQIRKKGNFGDVLGAVLFTGFMVLDAAAKVDAAANGKCTQHHTHTRCCKK